MSRERGRDRVEGEEGERQGEIEKKAYLSGTREQGVATARRRTAYMRRIC